MHRLFLPFSADFCILFLSRFLPVFSFFLSGFLPIFTFFFVPFFADFYILFYSVFIPFPLSLQIGMFSLIMPASFVPYFLRFSERNFIYDCRRFFAFTATVRRKFSHQTDIFVPLHAKKNGESMQILRF